MGSDHDDHRRLRRPIPGYCRPTPDAVRPDDGGIAPLGSCDRDLGVLVIEAVAAEKEQAGDIQITVRRLEDKIDRLAAENTDLGH
jgi:hypothetical protein